MYQPVPVGNYDRKILANVQDIKSPSAVRMCNSVVPAYRRVRGGGQSFVAIRSVASTVTWNARRVGLGPSSGAVWAKSYRHLPDESAIDLDAAAGIYIYS